MTSAAVNLFKRSSIVKLSPKLSQETQRLLMSSSILVQLVSAFGLGFTWVMALIRLILFAVCLLYGFVKLVYEYLSSKHITRDIQYGRNSRSYLDLYLPPSTPSHSKRPVVVFYTGGAWIIGYKGWAALLGRVLSEHGVVVVAPDYRNFPNGSIGDMVCDARDAMDWTMCNIHHYGGDPENVHMIGQSAGAHIASLAMLQQSVGDYSWGLKSFIGISGPYNIKALAPHFDSRGLYTKVLLQIMDGDLASNSPSILIREDPGYTEDLPPIFLFHGTEDTCVPDSSSFEFAFVLSQAGAEVHPRIYNGKSHTDPIIEDPMLGHDPLLTDILTIVLDTDTMLHQPLEPLVSRRAVKLARFFNPF